MLQPSPVPSSRFCHLILARDEPVLSWTGHPAHFLQLLLRSCGISLKVRTSTYLLSLARYGVSGFFALLIRVFFVFFVLNSRLGSTERVSSGVHKEDKVQAVELSVSQLGLFLFLHLHPDSTNHR